MSPKEVGEGLPIHCDLRRIWVFALPDPHSRHGPLPPSGRVCTAEIIDRHIPAKRRRNVCAMSVGRSHRELLLPDQEQWPVRGLHTCVRCRPAGARLA
eukprot:scaffold262445_cov35-Tisochrysis_lutea.AAC.1